MHRHLVGECLSCKVLTVDHDNLVAGDESCALSRSVADNLLHVQRVLADSELNANHFSGNRLSIINSSSNKLNNLLHIIDDQYVDKVDVNGLVEKAMPQILSELDPHSVYISAKDVQQATDYRVRGKEL